MKKIIGFSALVLMGVGCVSPRVMVSQQIISGRSAKYTYQLTGETGLGKNSAKLYNYAVRLCDYDNAGKETNCKDTLLMQNVAFHPVSYHR